MTQEVEMPDDCACGGCLKAWARTVAARYIAVNYHFEIPDTDLLLVVDPYRYGVQGAVWHRSDYLAYLKSLAKAEMPDAKNSGSIESLGWRSPTAPVMVAGL